MSDTKILSIDLIRTDGGTQGREQIDEDHVADLKSAWEAKVELPPLIVFFDGVDYWLADGFHRLYAARHAKRGSVPCDVRDGTKRDAWLESLRVNQGHGLRRTTADKRRLVTSAIGDVVLVNWTDRKIADHIGVTHPFVTSIRRQLESVTTSPAAKAADKPRVGKDGKKYSARKKKPSKPKISGGTTFNVVELTNESKDAFGVEAPKELRQVFELCEELDAQRAKLTGIKSWLTQRASHPGAVLLVDADQRIRTDLDQADTELKFAKPYCVCIYCHNKAPKVANCTACKGRGWMTEPVYKAAPKEMKREKAQA